jgi:GNAT superfamily N-acetyltransferase
MGRTSWHGAAGREALALVTQLLHRIRVADATAGLWEAADFEWWWRKPRRTDSVEQLFWLDGGLPVAAAMLTDWGNSLGLDPIVMPGAHTALKREVWQAGIDAVRRLPDDLAAVPVETRVRDDDRELASFLLERGFRPGEGDGTAWMNAAARPPRIALPHGFEIVDRGVSTHGDHWMARRSGPGFEARLRETSLYDASLDLSVRAPGGEVAGYALFWFDPVTLVGMLEPMRVEDAWQRRGLARALISEGLERLASRGATRMKVSFESEAARALYLGAGFELESTTTGYAMPAGHDRSS